MSAILLTIILNLALGLTAGAIMYRSDFCVAGMFRDLYLFGSTTMLRSLLLLILVSMILFELLRRPGLLLYPFPLLGPPSLANIIGGLVFGIGMVLAGGCVVGTLYKMGGGSMISTTAFAGLIIGSGFYAEIHPWWSGIIRKFSFLQEYKTLPQALGWDPLTLILPIVICSGLLFYRWHTTGEMELTAHIEGFIQPWKAAIGLALLGAISYLFVGMPFGITTAYAKTAAYLAAAVASDHAAQNAFYNTISLAYTLPFSHTEMKGGAGPLIDAIAYIQFPLIIGIIAGAMLTAWRLDEFKIYYRVPVRQYISALLGGIFLGLASRMTPGCNVWHLFGGIPILNMQSLLFLTGLFPGSYIGSKLLVSCVLSTPARKTI